MHSKHQEISDIIIEEEKKILGPLLGKLYISPASADTKLRETYDEVCIAVDDKLITDATGRNALLKLHVSLGKIVNVMNNQTSRAGRQSMAPSEARTSLAPESVVEDGEDDTAMTAAVDAALADDDEEDEEEETVIGARLSLPVRTRDNTILDELLNEEEEEL